MSKFYRVYVELTNICGLKCSFCPPREQPTQTMSLPFFTHVLQELMPYTKEIAYHMGGDSLTLSNLESYLDITHQKNFKVMLTTSGYYLCKHSMQTLLHPAIKQLNISLNSFNKNQTSLSFDAYMDAIIKVCKAKLEHNKTMFINLRLWNLDAQHSEKLFNEKLFAYLEKAFNTSLHVKTSLNQNTRSIRVAEKILLHFDTYFEWPSLHSTHHSDGTCLGLQSHFGILSNGKVVPCCLDKEGVIELGDLHVNNLHDILHQKRTQAIIDGFKHHKAVEPLCQKCSYKQRFKEE